MHALAFQLVFRRIFTRWFYCFSRVEARDREAELARLEREREVPRTLNNPNQADAISLLWILYRPVFFMASFAFEVAHVLRCSAGRGEAPSWPAQVGQEGRKRQGREGGEVRGEEQSQKLIESPAELRCLADESCLFLSHSLICFFSVRTFSLSALLKFFLLFASVIKSMYLINWFVKFLHLVGEFQ
jgi:hypothetical protein